MKSKLIGLTALSAFLSVACTNSGDEWTSDINENKELNKIEFVLGGSPLDNRVSGTRAMVVSEPVYKFVAGDKFGIYCEQTKNSNGGVNAAYNALLTLDDANGKFSDFNYYWASGSKNTVYLYFPYNENSISSAMTIVRGTMSSTQVQNDAESASATLGNNLLYRKYDDFATYKSGKFYVENLKPYFPTIQFSVVGNSEYAGWKVTKATLVSSTALGIGSYRISLSSMAQMGSFASTTTTFTVTPASGTIWTLAADKAVNIFMTVPTTTTATTLTLTVEIEKDGLSKTIGLSVNPSLTLEQGKTYAYYFALGSGTITDHNTDVDTGKGGMNVDWGTEQTSSGNVSL